MTFNIALFGFGTVGFSIYEILERELGNSIHANLGVIVVRNKQKYIQNMIEDSVPDDTVKYFETIIQDDFDAVLQAISSFDVIIEVMGGIEHAWDVVRKSLSEDKIVITANKALLSTYMTELDHLNKNCNGKLYYEASVAGGIPVIKSLFRDIQWTTAEAFSVSNVSGILNGTCNYILTEMEKRKITYDEALVEAKDKGYAEADSSADVLGLDTRAKIHILQRITYGAQVYANDIVCEGITKIEPIDFVYASQMHRKIKLIGSTFSNASGVRAWVMPSVVSTKNPIANTDNVKNIVSINHETMGSIAFSGNGAGGETTAHSVLSDLHNAMQNNQDHQQWFGTASYANKNMVAPIVLPFYVRLNVRDKVGIIADVGQICEDLQISIDAILQNPLPKNFDYINDELQFVLVTNLCSYDTIQQLKTIIILREWCLRDPFIMAVVD